MAAHRGNRPAEKRSPVRVEKYVEDVALKDGSLVRVRPMREVDKNLLADLLEGLTEKTFLSRFIHSGEAVEKLVQEFPVAGGGLSLLAVRDGKVVAVADYRLLEPDSADIGVVVADMYQHKGLGTKLLGRLAQAASGAGISTFRSKAGVTTDFALDFVRNLGFPVEINAARGYVVATFPTSIQPSALEAFERREAMSSRAAVRRFLKARSVAVIGASRDRSSIGGALFRNVLEANFNGPVYPVNRESPVVQTVTAYRSVLECPGPVDLAFIVVPAAFAVQAARQCAEKGVQAIVVISAGFAELGAEGARTQEELVRVCRESGMRLIGPNCMGIVNTEPGVSLNGQFAAPVSAPGRIGFLSQSGALGYVIIDQANKLGLGMSSFISIGNMADISSNDLLQYWEEDENTDLILLHLESIGDPRKFARLARRIARKKPIVVVKAGRSAAGFRGTRSHTGALVAASETTVEALFRQSGVIRTDSLEEMFDVAALLSTQPVPKGDRVAILTNSGGPGILAADACESLGVHVPELSEKTRAELTKFLLPIAGTRNPVDMTSVADAKDYGRAIRAIAKDPKVDAMIIIFIPPIAVRTEDVAAEIVAATRDLKGKLPIMTNFMAAKGVSGQLSGGGVRIPAYPFPELAAQALSQTVHYAKWLASPLGTFRTFPKAMKLKAAAVVSKALANNQEWLDPSSTDALLSCYGIPLVRTARADSPEEAAKAALGFTGRVVLKAFAPGLVHKTELGAVKVGIAPEEVEGEALEMAARLKKNGFPEVGLLVQEFISDAIEMFVGVTNDPNFGPLVACGAGGALVELIGDVAVRLTPLSDMDASQMVRTLKTYPLLDGYRGEPKRDVKALEELLLSVGRMVEDIPEIAELDLNPVMVFREGMGALVVDARIRVAESTALFGTKKH